MVCTRCMTYNHAPYIEDALKGFSIQITPFPVVYTIIDDASNDGAQDIMRKWAFESLQPQNNSPLWKEMPYGQLCVAELKNNSSATFVILLLAENHYQTGRLKLRNSYINEWHNEAKYTAICEGDDYWTDPNKLQKQVEWLEKHDDYSMCFHQAIEHSENRLFSDRPFAIIENREYKGVELYRKWIIATASVVYWTSIHNTQIFKETRENKNFCYGDITLFLSCAHEGKVRGMSDTMSVYRRNDGGVTFSVFNTYKKALKTAVHNHEIYKVFGEEYKADSNRIVLTILCSNYVKPNVPAETRREMINYAKSISTYRTYIMICKFYALSRLRDIKHLFVK